MSSSRLVRGAKTRMFACFCFIAVLGALLYVFHGTQTRLSDVQKLATTCTQQQESLSAQLQVIFEYKLRLEKALRKEKTDHIQTKDTFKAEKETRDKERTEAVKKYDALVQKYKLEKTQYDDEKEAHEKAILKMKEKMDKMEELKDNAIKELEKFKADYFVGQDQIKDLENQLNVCKSKNEEHLVDHYKKENSQLKDELTRTKTDLDACKDEIGRQDVSAPKDQQQQPPKQADNTHALEAPKLNPVHGTNNSTTPGINPDAVSNQELSSAKPSVRDAEGKEVVLLAPKKSTQESAAPLPLPMGGGQQLLGQIPQPPKPAANPETLKRPNTNYLQQQDSAVRENNAAEVNDNNNNILGPLNPVIGADGQNPGDTWNQLPGRRDHNNAVEEEEDADPQFPKLRENLEIPRPVKGQYQGGDYDKEEQVEEEEDEGEQMDYLQGNEQVRKDDQMKQVVGALHVRHVQDHNGGGIMVNPK